MPNRSGKTVVKGIRADRKFFEMCDEVAKVKKTDRNKLIVKVVSSYCKKIKKSLDKSPTV